MNKKGQFTYKRRDISQLHLRNFKILYKPNNLSRYLSNKLIANLLVQFCDLEESEIEVIRVQSGNFDSKQKKCSRLCSERLDYRGLGADFHSICMDLRSTLEEWVALKPNGWCWADWYLK